MKNLHALIDAIAFIEENLQSPFSQQDIADYCHVSLSGLQKLFRYALHCSVKDYITRRRITESAGDIGKATILDIALKYQYQSPEVFARAFRKVWGVAPSKFSGAWTFTSLFPRVRYNYEGDEIMLSRQFDISQLYEEIRKRMGCYTLSFDIKGLTEINAVSTEAGDIAIRECLKRIDSVTGDTMLLFRIGGDEFALLTDVSEAKAAHEIARQVICENGRPIVWNGAEIPVSMRCGGAILHADTLKYDKLFSQLMDKINSCRDADSDIVIL